MKERKWNLLKSERLKKTRGVSFEEIVQTRLVAVKKHPNRAEQNVMLFEYKAYIWVVPYLTRENDLFKNSLSE